MPRRSPFVESDQRERHKLGFGPEDDARASKKFAARVRLTQWPSSDVDADPALQLFDLTRTTLPKILKSVPKTAQVGLTKNLNDSACCGSAARCPRSEFREPQPSFAHAETSLRTEHANLEASGKGANTTALSSIDIRVFDHNLLSRSAGRLRALRSELAIPERTRLRQLAGATRI